MMVTYLIDDESNCTDVLQVRLQKHRPEIQIGGIFNDPEQALVGHPKGVPAIDFPRH